MKKPDPPVTHDVTITFNASSKKVSVSPKSFVCVKGDKIRWKAGDLGWAIHIVKDPGPMGNRTYRAKGKKAGGDVTVNPSKKTTYKYIAIVSVDGKVFLEDPDIVVKPRP